MLRKRLKGLLALALAATLSVTMLVIPSAAESNYCIFVTDQVPEDRSDRTSTTRLMVDYGSGNVEMALPATVYSLALSYGAVDPIQEITGWKAWGGKMYSGDGGYNHWEKWDDNVAVGASGGDTVTIAMAEQAEAAAGGRCYLSLEIDWRYRTLKFPLYNVEGKLETTAAITANKGGNVICTGYKDGTKCSVMYGTSSPRICKTKEELWKALTDIAAAQGESFTDSKIRLASLTVDNAWFDVDAPLAGKAAPSGDIRVDSPADALKARISKWTDKNGNTVDKFENCKDYTVHIDLYCENDAYEVSSDLSIMLGDIRAECEIEQNEGVYSFSYTFEGGHGKPIVHEAKEATCSESGNIEYYECEDCGTLFIYSDDGSVVEITLADTVIPKNEHVLLGEYQHDANSHWHICQLCRKIFEKEAHRGGTATATKKAVCEVCGQEYGDYAKPAVTTTTTTAATTPPMPIVGPSGTRPNTSVTTTTTTTMPIVVPVETIPNDLDDDTLTPPDEENKIIINADSADDVDKIIAEIENADDGTTIVINVNTNISAEEQARISTALMGRDLILVADYGDYRWIIDSNDITSSAPIFAEIAIGLENVSNTGWETFFGERSREYGLTISFPNASDIIPFSINHNGSFGGKVKLEIDRESKLEGYLNLYHVKKHISLDLDNRIFHYVHYDDLDNSLNNEINFLLDSPGEFVEFIINNMSKEGHIFKARLNNKTLQLELTHASDYIIVVDKYDHSKDADKAIEITYTPDPADSDNNPNTGVTLGFAAVFIAGAAAAVSRKRKK